MKYVRWAMGYGLIFALVAGILALAAMVRLVPIDPLVWHVDPSQFRLWEGVAKTEAEVMQTPAGAVARVPGLGAGGLRRLNAIALATPRTVVLAGSVAKGRITWVTRSALWGFPDITTAGIGADEVGYIWARQRYGSVDGGVNLARLRAWLAALDQGG